MDNIFLFEDDTSLTLTQLAKSYKDQLNTRPLKFIDNAVKVESMAWLCAFNYRKPDTNITFKCFTCGVQDTLPAVDMTKSNSILFKHNQCASWESRKSTSRSSTVNSNGVTLEIINNKLDKILQRLGQ